MDTAHASGLLDTVARALAALKSKGNLLEEITWPRAVEERFFARGASELPEFTPSCDRDLLDAENATLAAVEKGIDGEGPVVDWLRNVVRGVVDRNRLLMSAGTPEFGRLSREIYGGAATAFLGLPLRNVDLADHLLERLRVHGWDEATDRDETPMAAAAFATELQARIDRHRPRAEVTVVLDEQCTAKALAGMTHVRVRPDATFSSWEADGLFCHEVETHAFTALNGAAQAHAPFLRAGGPRTTPTQEGLAVFSELYNGALAAPRLERLATRVKLVGLAEDGASFLDLYRYLLDRGSAPHDAFLDAARVCRGGRTAGGAPFTKDACYLAGLLHVYVFLAMFVRGGFRDEVELLACGRISLDDVTALIQLRELGLLSRPHHRPRWMQRWTTLLPYFAFQSFFAGVDIGAIEAHYRPAVDLALAAVARR
jgi:uncharacterized protein (TIGR02421 family)